MKPNGFGAIVSALMSGQAGAIVLAASGFAVIGLTSALALNAVSAATTTQLSTTPRITDSVLIKAPQPLDIQIAAVPRPAPIAEPVVLADPATEASAASEPQTITVIAVTPTIVEAALPSCVTELASFVEGTTIHFSTASATLTADEKEVLRGIGLRAADCPDALVQVEGHTDSVGPDLVNLQLSWQRAENTLAALEILGIETSQFEPVGYGARSPMTQGDASEDHLNRRVEFTVLKRPEPGA